MFGLGKSKPTISADVQDRLLQDPQVRASIQRAGEQALSDPQVQQQIMETCKEKFPEYAEVAKEEVQAWARDPKTQARAKEYAGKALQYVAGAGEQVLKHIEQGPAGVRVLAFVAAAASAADSFVSVFDVFTVVLQPVTYIVSSYQLLFALTSMLFEAPPDWIVAIEEKTNLPISKYQDLLMLNARFLSLAGGRGLFYIFQGTMWLAFASFTELLNLAVGVFLMFVGTIHLLLHFGFSHVEIAQKMRHGYEAVSTTPH